MRHIQKKTNENSAARASTIYMNQEVYHAGPNKHPLKTSMSVPTTSYRCDQPDVPEYKEHITLRDNVIQENNGKLDYWPYFDDEELPEVSTNGLWAELDNNFQMENEFRRIHVPQAVQSLVHTPYVERFFKELGIGWEDVLFFLLAPEEEITELIQHAREPVDPQVKKLLSDRKASCNQDFDRDSPRWEAIFSKLSTSSILKLVLSAFACKAFLESAGLSMWHLARRTEIAKEDVPDPESQIILDPEEQYRMTACRICHLQDCPFHGEIREYPDSDDETAQSEVASPPSPAKPDDSESDPDEIPYVEEKCMNYRKIVHGVPRRYNETEEELNMDYPFNANYWLNKSDTHMLHKRPPFYPCNHEGSCQEADCSCNRAKINCEKTCGCHISCYRRFRGCSCAKNSKIRTCFDDNRCECRRLNRECDGDLCGKCGAAEILDPVNRYNEDIKKNKCCNVGVTLNLPKKTFLVQSEVHGFGLLCGERVKKGDYLGEYKGEVITTNEGTRRGTIYAHSKTNYLFTLNTGK